MRPTTIVAAVLFLFAGLVIVLPAVRVWTGALRLRAIVGFLLTGVAFLVLGTTLLGGISPASEPVVVGAVALAFVGSVVQKRVGRSETSNAQQRDGR